MVSSVSDITNDMSEIDAKRSPGMRDPISLFLFCACVVAVSGSGVELSAVRVGVFVALTCDDVDLHRQSVLNATVEAAISQTTYFFQRHRFNLSVEFDVVDACLTEDSVTHLTAALENSSSSYVAVAGPGLYHLCGIASALQRRRQVAYQLYQRRQRQRRQLGRHHHHHHHHHMHCHKMCHVYFKLQHISYVSSEKKVKN